MGIGLGEKRLVDAQVSTMKAMGGTRHVKSPDAVNFLTNLGDSFVVPGFEPGNPMA